MSEATAVTAGLLVFFEEFPNALIPSAPAKTTSTTRTGKIFRRIFSTVDMLSLAGTAELLTPWFGYLQSIIRKSPEVS